LRSHANDRVNVEDIFARAWDNLLGRLGGPLSFRFLIQPAVAALVGIVAGVRDAQAGRPAYFYAIFTDTAHRSDRLRECWGAVWRVFVVAAMLDIVYEIIVFKTIYPGETLIVAFSLAVVPYVVVRGPANRIARLWLRRSNRQER
jgi:hypothetical protein